MNSVDFDDNELSPQDSAKWEEEKKRTDAERSAEIQARWPLTVDLGPLERASRTRRFGLVFLIGTCCGFLIGLFILTVGVWDFVGRSPYPVEAFLLLAGVFLAPAGYGVWRLWNARPGTYPTMLIVTRQGILLRYRSGYEWSALWADPRVSLWVTDVTACDLYPSMLPGGYYLGEPSTWLGQIWIPEESFVSLMESAKRSGITIQQTELQTEHGLSGRLASTFTAGTLVYHIAGRG